MYIRLWYKNPRFCNILSFYIVLWPGFCSKLSYFKRPWSCPFLKNLCHLNVKECAEGLVEHFHILHFTKHLRHYIIIDHKWKLLTSYISIKLCLCYIQMNQSKLQKLKFSKISQSINVEWRTCKHFFQGVFPLGKMTGNFAAKSRRN